MLKAGKWAQPPSLWTGTAANVFADKVSTQRSYTYCPPDRHLVSERKLRRIQRPKYHNLLAKLCELWDQYEAKE